MDDIASRITLLRRLFCGRTDIYGTYDPATKRSWQVKGTVMDSVIAQHVRGIRPLGIYPLMTDVVRFGSLILTCPTKRPSRDLCVRSKHVDFTPMWSAANRKGITAGSFLISRRPQHWSVGI
ncbi:MAG: hypothetical protein WC661_01325 [Opitutaceae bacterium]|jgi:hypothetical protein